MVCFPPRTAGTGTPDNRGATSLDRAEPLVVPDGQGLARSGGRACNGRLHAIEVRLVAHGRRAAGVPDLGRTASAILATLNRTGEPDGGRGHLDG